MVKLIINTIFFACILGIGVCAGLNMNKGQLKVVYKCPEGQVKVLEDGVEKCYTPGVSYTDFRPIQVKVAK